MQSVLDKNNPIFMSMMAKMSDHQRAKILLKIKKARKEGKIQPLKIAKDKPTTKGNDGWEDDGITLNEHGKNILRIWNEQVNPRVQSQRGTANPT